MLERLLQESQKLLHNISQKALEEYIQKQEIMTEYINEKLSADPTIKSLIGGNPLSMMYDNHRHHILFMHNVMHFRHHEMLVKTILWVYRAYKNRHFSYDYFPLELKTWIEAMEKYLPLEEARPIIELYHWLLSQHENMILLSLSGQKDDPVVQDTYWKQIQQEFFSAILDGNHYQALSIADKSITSWEDLSIFFLDIIQTSMYKIGNLWERGEIGVDREHLASAVVARVMAVLYTKMAKKMVNKGKALITAAPNEFHQIGAWMISDLLEFDGWETKYLGANLPIKDLMDLLRSFQPHLLAISITMPFNISQAQEMIAQARNIPTLPNMKIMVGGAIVNSFPEICKELKADGTARDAREAVLLARQWRLQEEEKK